MRDLVGRLSGLDPTATETLRVIEYFDTLVAGHVGLEAFLRGATLLTGVAAGLAVPERRLLLRVDTEGRRAHESDTGPESWANSPLDDGGAVWIERVGPPHANDPMVLERLAMGVTVTLDRSALAGTETGARIEQLIDGSLPLEVRLRAADRLHLDAGRAIRVVAAPPDDAVAARSRWATVVGTVAGPVSVVLCQPTAELPSRAGIGCTVRPADVAAAWSEALTALRLTSARRPIMDVTELGALTVLAAGVDARSTTAPDVAVLEGLVAKDATALETIDELVDHASVRACAAALGVHHSTLQHRIATIRVTLGFDPTEPRGHHRLALAVATHRLLTTRFDHDPGDKA